MKSTHLTDNISFTYNAEVAIHVDSMITAHVNVYSYVFRTENPNLEWSLDPMDTEVDWFLNGERVKHDGFKELYFKLYGEDKYRTLLDNVCAKAEKLIEGRVCTSFSDILRDKL